MQNRYCIVITRYELMSELVDDIVGESMLLRTTMGMPEREADDIPDDSSKYLIAMHV